MPRPTDFHFNKHHFRHHVFPERNEGLDVGIVGQRFNVGRFKSIVTDGIDLLTATIGVLTATTANITTLTVSTTATVPTPSAATDAATKAYVDAQIEAQSGWEDTGTLVRLATISDQVTMGLAAAFSTYKLAIKSDTMLALQGTTGAPRTWTFSREAPTHLGSVETLALSNDGTAGLKLYVSDVAGGQRVWLWDGATTLPNVPHTGIPPTFAVFGDILCGDIVALLTNPMTYFKRASTGLAATAVTAFFSAKFGSADTDGGAQLVLAPAAGAATEDGYVESIAYGTGSGTLANNVIFTTRSGAGAVTRRWRITSAGMLIPHANNTYAIGTTALGVKEVYISAGTGTAIGKPSRWLVRGTGTGTGSPADENENDLKSYTVPAATLATNGDTLHFYATYRCAANATTKNIRIKYGGTTLSDSTVIAHNGSMIVAEGWITRTAAATQIAYVRVNETANNPAWSTAVTGGVAQTAPGETLAGTVVLKSTVDLGTGAAANDVIQDEFWVEYIPA